MPATSPDAISRKNQRLRDKRRKAKEPARLSLQKSDLPGYKIMARRMRPRLPAGTTKADLREMLAQAAANTARK